YLVIGPWDHGGTYFPAKEIQGLAIPAPAVLDMKALHRAWYAYALGRGPRPELIRDAVAEELRPRAATERVGVPGAVQGLHVEHRRRRDGETLDLLRRE